jgi:DSF synthase
MSNVDVIQAIGFSNDPSKDGVQSEHLRIFTSNQVRCDYAPKHTTLWTHWSPAGIPSFNLDLLSDLTRASRQIETYFSAADRDRPLDYIVIRSGLKGVFNVGGDLGYFQRLITTQDRARLTEYAQSAVNVIYRNFISHNLSDVTTVALLEGDALGGGLECALSCDIVIAERHVKAGFPEVLFNMFPGMGGMSFLARRASRHVAEEMVRTGRQYSASELLDFGLIDEVVDTGDGIRAVERLSAKRQRQRAAHSAMNRVNRLVRPVSLEELHDVVTIWVDCAMKMSPHSLQWMQRLYHRQLSIFGRPLDTLLYDVAEERLSAA